MGTKGGWSEFDSMSAPASLARPAGGPSPRTRQTTQHDLRHNPQHKAQQKVRVQRTKAGKGGKVVTTITGLDAPEAELKAWLRQLKAAAGTGGTLKDGVIELQGDQVAPALAALEQAGYRPRQAGG